MEPFILSLILIVTGGLIGRPLLMQKKYRDLGFFSALLIISFTFALMVAVGVEMPNPTSSIKAVVKLFVSTNFDYPSE